MELRNINKEQAALSEATELIENLPPFSITPEQASLLRRYTSQITIAIYTATAHRGL